MLFLHILLSVDLPLAMATLSNQCSLWQTAPLRIKVKSLQKIHFARMMLSFYKDNRIKEQILFLHSMIYQFFSEIQLSFYTAWPLTWHWRNCHWNT